MSSSLTKYSKIMNSEVLERLQRAFSSIDFTPEITDFFQKSWKERTFPRANLITEAGTVERYFYFVLEGVQAIYVINSNGDKVVLGFSYGGNFSGVYPSFLKGAPSNYFLEALTPSKLLGLTLEHFQHLYDQFPEFEKWGRLFCQNIILGRASREVELLTLSAEERYVQFMKRCPEQLLQIPQKYLASYLNMKPETFSRLRRKVKY